MYCNVLIVLVGPLPKRGTISVEGLCRGTLSIHDSSVTTCSCRAHTLLTSHHCEQWPHPLGLLHSPMTMTW